MEFFNNQRTLDFMGVRKLAMAFSWLLVLASFAGLGLKGLNLGLDFTGGSQIQVQGQRPLSLADLRNRLAKAGFEGASVQNVGSTHQAVIRLKPAPHQSAQALQKRLQALFPSLTLAGVSTVGPQVGQKLWDQGILALVVSLLATMFYIALRFESRFALAAALALLHDPILILGIFAWFQWEFNLITLAALLTILGYSLNDTIVVYDRIRENFRRHRKLSVTEIVNLSVTQTLSRTIMTSGLTLLVVLALLLFGGHALAGFASALIIGILIGTYSSIYIAGSVSVMLGLQPPKP